MLSGLHARSARSRPPLATANGTFARPRAGTRPGTSATAHRRRRCVPVPAGEGHPRRSCARSSRCSGSASSTRQDTAAWSCRRRRACLRWPPRLVLPAHSFRMDPVSQARSWSRPVHARRSADLPRGVTPGRYGLQKAITPSSRASTSPSGVTARTRSTPSASVTGSMNDELSGAHSRWLSAYWSK